jgi:hypothetical protein
VLLLNFHTAAGQSRSDKPKQSIAEKKHSSVIKGRCAIIIRPDNKKVKLLKKGIAEDDYMTFVMDNEYYMGMASNFLDSVKLKQIVKQSKGILDFQSSSGRYFRVRLDSFGWGIILFNGRTKPISADVTDIEEDYRAYMKK